MYNQFSGHNKILGAQQKSEALPRMPSQLRVWTGQILSEVCSSHKYTGGLVSSESGWSKYSHVAFKKVRIFTPAKRKETERVQTQTSLRLRNLCFWWLHVITRTGFNPMQLHCSPLWEPRVMVFGQVVHFCQIYSLRSSIQ